ncbi:hypothetical protein ARMGADRAFT_1040652 [Armillaria gallica]|uniref:Uncharacterized protein n=1 Tax=Armillaria gallica TaxID=47427 RepID=A0A2H3CSD4_ARMGA|nr:hypothetical protein ARMGADRAFT_1040652 [Armillaria gallica]
MHNFISATPLSKGALECRSGTSGRVVASWKVWLSGYAKKQVFRGFHKGFNPQPKQLMILAAPNWASGISAMQYNKVLAWKTDASSFDHRSTDKQDIEDTELSPYPYTHKSSTWTVFLISILRDHQETNTQGTQEARVLQDAGDSLKNSHMMS